MIAVGVVALLIVTASRYGYHRDELYFLATGRHLAWSYPDQGPVTPLIARAMSALSATSLTVLRIPPAVAAGATVATTGLLAREFGARPRGQSLAAAVSAVAAIVLFTGHTLSTSTFDLLVWAVVTWLAARAVRAGTDRLWLVAGAVLGVGLLNKPLPVFLAAAVLLGLAVAGPRRVLRSPWLWAGAALALVLWSPWLAWQSAHGWPQLAVSRSIAAGGSTSSVARWQVVPFQVLLAGPVLAPVWIAGLVRLFRDGTVRSARFLGWAWLFLAVVFTVAGGKPYYLAGLLPALIGAGAAPVDRWLDRGRPRIRVAASGAALAISAAVGVLIALPVLPARDAGPVIAMNPDVGETIGWPELAAAVAQVRRQLPAGTPVVILTANYGEAGAIDRYGPAYGLPRAYSGHNAYGEWGPPPDDAAPVIAVGLPPEILAGQLRDCAVSARIDNTARIDNGERGRSIALCAGPRRSWRASWPALRHLA